MVRLIRTMVIAGAALSAFPALAQTGAAAAGGVPQATPIGNPASWFPADAYPPAAKTAGMEGRTAFLIDVDAKGRVTGCNITSSSGSPLLDSTTCNLLVVNARFRPAHDASGNTVPGVWTSAMVWKLTAAPPAQPEGIGTEDGPSAAEIYNENIAAETKAASGDDDDQGQGQGQGDDGSHHHEHAGGGDGGGGGAGGYGGGGGYGGEGPGE
jgi:protein TonB